MVEPRVESFPRLPVGASETLVPYRLGSGFCASELAIESAWTALRGLGKTRWKMTQVLEGRERWRLHHLSCLS